MISSIENAAFYAKESGMYGDRDEEYDGKMFYEKGAQN